MLIAFDKSFPVFACVLISYSFDDGFQAISSFTDASMISYIYFEVLIY
jgi:hypothetical protein